MNGNVQSHYTTPSEITTPTPTNKQRSSPCSSDPQQVHTIINQTPSQKRKSTTIVGDSMISGLESWRMGNKENRVSSRVFPGATTIDMLDYVKPTVRRKPDNIIVHVGTNDLNCDTPTRVAENIVTLCEYIERESPSSRIAVSGIICREDELSGSVEPTNKVLKSFCRSRGWDFLQHKIDKSCLNSRGLHLNKKGTSVLAAELISYIKGSN